MTIVVTVGCHASLEQLRAIADLGVDGLYLHHVGQPQEAFTDTFATEALPQLRS